MRLIQGAVSVGSTEESIELGALHPKLFIASYISFGAVPDQSQLISFRIRSHVW